jgi:hypothetical protein
MSGFNQAIMEPGYPGLGMLQVHHFHFTLGVGALNVCTDGKRCLDLIIWGGGALANIYFLFEGGGIFEGALGHFIAREIIGTWVEGTVYGVHDSLLILLLGIAMSYGI